MNCKKVRGKGSRGKPPRSGENRYVISFEDARACEGKIVAVNGFPAPGEYKKVIAAGVTVEELKEVLRIMCKDVTAHIVPGSGVACYINATYKQPLIEVRRKGV